MNDPDGRAMGIAHDLNNLLTAILGFASMGTSLVSADHPVARKLMRIQEAAERASELTQELLAVSRRSQVPLVPPSTEAPGVVPSPPQDRPRTVLVVEDEPALQELAVEILEEQGHRVLRAASAAEARTVFASSLHPVDLVISDMNLPDGRGTVLLAELLSQKPGLRVVFMSGFDEEGTDGLGGARFLRKPFSLGELADAVALALTGA